MIVPRLPGSLMPSRMRVSPCECWSVGVLECSAPPLVGGVGRGTRMLTTKSPSRFELKVDIRSSSFSEIISYRNGISLLCHPGGVVARDPCSIFLIHRFPAIMPGNDGALAHDKVEKNLSVKYPSIISKSESINSIIPFRHSTRKSPDSWRPDFS